MSQYSVQVFVDQDSFLIGHVAIKLTNSAGESTAVGYYPENDGSNSISNTLNKVLGYGDVKNDADRLPLMEGKSAVIDISQSQYEAMINYANHVDSDTTSSYYLGGDGLGLNCATFARNLLDAGGVPHPDIEMHPYEYLPYSVVERTILDALLDLSNRLIELGNFFSDIRRTVNDWFLSARNMLPWADPLTLDLDGDGLETVGIDANNPTLFDHDADGVATATGWIKPDDGLLVLDRDDNGTIDNGTELFGDSTPLYAGGNAEDGFAALAQEDTNNDGLVDANDAHFADLRIWQDADSDGQTDAGELHALDEFGIAALHVAKRENSTLLANGNQVADLGTFVRDDGTEGTLGQVTGSMADIDLASNPFYREFTDSLPLTDRAAALPDMQGSGLVRDMREAASLSSDMAAVVEAYAAADTRGEQLALVDNLIASWAHTTGSKSSIEQAEDQGYNLIYLIPGLSPSVMMPFTMGSGGSDGQAAVFSETGNQRLDELIAKQASITYKIGILEQFNGLTFVEVEPDGVRTGAGFFLTAETDDRGTGGIASFGANVFVPLRHTPVDWINASYEALRQSVYDH